nr:hypothetical protein [Tanacetum cinerariifolium]
MREDSQNSSAKTSSTRYRNPSERPQIRDRLRSNDGNVFGQLGHRRESAFKRLSDTYSPSAAESRPDREYSKDNSYSRGCPHKRNSSPSRDCPRSRGRSHVVEESYDNTYSSYRTRDKHRERHQRMRALEVKVKGSRKMRMPNNVKTYDGIGDLEDHVKIFQAATQVECWAMPTWCHMLNSTLIGATRVWFDELPSKSIDGYNDIKAAFLAYFMQQKKYVKDPVEIHNIKQRDRDAIEDFMERFKVETGRMNGAPECMRISEFMHGVNNPELTKRLNEHVPKTMEEMMKKRSDFRGQPKEWKGSNIFTSLTRTPKEILVAEAVQSPPPMVTPVEKISNNKFCDFHNDKGHSTDECMQLKEHIEELVRAGKLSHLNKEIKQGRDQRKVGKKEAPSKDKFMIIYMIQSWHRMTRKKVTQSFERVREITFLSLTNSNSTEGPLVIEAEIGGHMIHRMYVDGGSSTKVLYEHCFNWLRLEVKNQMG